MAWEIVVVEDDARIAELLIWFLERRGYSVRLAASFEEARTLLEERRPDLVLSDVQLGGSSAGEELPKLAADGLLPCTVVVSGFLDGKLEKQLAAITEVVATVRKPYELPDLEALIRSQLVVE